MRFDTVRAMEQVVVFSFDRRAGSEGEGRAADLAKSAFERAGYLVHCEELTGSPIVEAIRLSLARLGSAIGLSAPAVAGVFRAWTLPFAVVSIAFGMSWPWLVARAFQPIFKRGWLRSSKGAKYVGGSRLRRPDAPVRVVFVTSLDMPRPVLSGTLTRVGRRVKGMLTVAIVLLDLALGAMPSGPRPAFILSVVAAYLAAALIDFLSHFRPNTNPGEADNRDGLATLIELARTWPSGRDERIEIQFGAVAGRFFDRAGLKSLNGQIEHLWRRKPTLVIGLWSPGLGPPFDLAANGLEGYDVMTSSADDLWIPHRSADGRDLWPFGTGDPEFVAVVGSSDRATVTPESLGLVAQLATEIALRWARRSTAQERIMIEFRSSQNPG